MGVGWWILVVVMVVGSGMYYSLNDGFHARSFSFSARNKIVPGKTVWNKNDNNNKDDSSWMPNVGNYSLPITVGNGPAYLKVQRLFDTGLMHCYGFAQRQAQEMANQALHDTNATAAATCPMCFWLAAMARAPFLNHPILSNDTFREARHAAQQAVQAAAQHRAVLTAKESALIHSLSVRFDTIENPTAGYQAYREALRNVLQQPQLCNDTDLLAFYADAIMVLHCDDNGYHFYQDDNRTPLPDIVEAMDVLEHCLAVSFHPLCAHLYIHVTEPSLQPERASAVAQKLSNWFADTQAQHLQHMPSHTALRVGSYHQAVQANVQARASDQVWIQHDQWPYGPAHDLAFLIHAAGLSGERDVAYHYADQLRQHYADHPNQPDGPGPEQGWHIWRTTRLRFGDWQAVLDDSDQLPRPDWPYAVLLGHFCKGIAVLRTEPCTTDPAKEYLNQLRQVATGIEQEGFRSISKVADGMLSAAIALADGLPDVALNAIRLARQEQDSWTYNEPPKWFLSMTACEAALLQQLGHHEQAMALFEQDATTLVKDSRFAVYGLLQSMRASSRSSAPEIAAVEARYQEASKWARPQDDPPQTICPAFESWSFP